MYTILTKMRKGLHIGTSGWSYEKEWKGPFYTSASSMLHQYLSYFDTAEINSTFYALPKQNFIKHLSTIDRTKFFTAKLPKKVTHDHRLDLSGEAGEVLDQFYELLKPIEDRLHVLLIQLPPWKLSAMSDLETFLSHLQQPFRYAIEFRDTSWFIDSVWSLLEKYDIAHCIVDEPKLPIDLRITTDFSYIRWHGHGENLWYDYRYTVKELEHWKPNIQKVMSSVDTAYGYFNNHFAGNAPLNALQMLALLEMANRKQERKLLKMLEKDKFNQTSLDDF